MSETYVAPSREGKKSITIWTEPERHTALKMEAARRGVSIQELVAQAIDRELKRKT